MPSVQLSNVIVPQVFNRYMVEDTMIKTAIFQSGVMRADPSMADFLKGGGLTVNMPFWMDLDSKSPGIANDNPASIATPGIVAAANNLAIRNVRTRGWSAANLTAELAGSDPMMRIRERVSNYWSRAFQRHLVSELVGVFASNAANNGGDMQNVIGLDVAGAPTSANLVSAGALLDTAQTMGDQGMTALGLLICHSVIATALRKQNLIDFIPDSEGHVRFETYMGYKMIVDDGCPVVQGTTNTARYLYTSYLLGEGAFGWAEAPVAIPVETFRHPEQGNGMGVEDLWTRRQYLMSPMGVKWTDSSRAGQFPTDAENQMAANWLRIFPERKQVRMAALISNG